MKKAIPIYLNKIIAFVLLLICTYSVYRKLLDGDMATFNFKQLFGTISSTTGISIITIVITLSLFNWLLEAYKWKYLLKKTINISIQESIKSVLIGLALTLFTPFRVGSFVGRVWFFPKKTRIKSAIASIFGGLAQLYITVVVGLISMTILSKILENTQYNYVLIASILLLLLISWVYFFPSYLIKMIGSVKTLKNRVEYFEILQKYNTNDKLQVLLLSLARYATFIIQYYLILRIFAPDLTLLNIVFYLGLIFLITSIAPSIIFGLGLRELTAVLVISPSLVSGPAVVLSSLILWLINMILPATTGSIIFFLKKQIGNDD